MKRDVSCGAGVICVASHLQQQAAYGALGIRKYLPGLTHRHHLCLRRQWGKVSIVNSGFIAVDSFQDWIPGRES